MKAFSSWSGGKDCMFALYLFLQKEGNKINYLVNMCENNSDLSLSHGISRKLVKKQAEKLNIPLIQKEKGSSYEENLKSVIQELKKEGVTAGIFGDIYLQEHRDWIERVCTESGIEAIFPLWGRETSELLQDFIQSGFKTITVSVHEEKLTEDWLGKELDENFLKNILKLKDIDPCAEKGEYHTFVFDGPLFKSAVDFTKGEITQRNKHYFLEIKP